LVERVIQSKDKALLPYPQVEIRKIYVRKCYEDVFNLLIQRINLNEKSFAISGTPGIGKSLFFVYILYHLMNDMKTLSFQPNQVVYQSGPACKCYDLQQQIVTDIAYPRAAQLVRQQDTFYIIDGQTSEPFNSPCVVLFISSPCLKEYKEFVKQNKAKKWFFPVWTLAKLHTCHTINLLMYFSKLNLVSFMDFNV
jgi:hypothetical protein